MRIGIDFDNTIVSYDHVFAAEAKNRGLIPENFSGAKIQIRDQIRTLEDGEIKWQELQGRVYGAGMPQAEMIAGVETFLKECRARNYDVFIVSHKTRYGHHDPERVDLRQAARTWMDRHGFFNKTGFGLQPENLFFETTRTDKVARIKDLGCTLFIDDLFEVFVEEDFPDEVERYLFQPSGTAPEGPY